MLGIRQINVLKHNGFGLLALATLLSRFGDIVAGLGFLYLAYRMTGSQSTTTGVALAEVLPYLLFGLMGGVLSDSAPKLRVMVGANLYRAVLEIATVILVLIDKMPIELVIIIPFLMQLGGVVYNPCSRASVVHIVEPEWRVAANSMMSIIENTTAIAAPFLAAAIMLFENGIWLFFAIHAITFVVSAVLLGKLGSTPKGRELCKIHLLPDSSLNIFDMTLDRIKLFWRGVGTSPTLVLLFASTFLAVLFGTWAWRMGALFISVPHPSVSTWFFSLLLAVYSVSGIITGLVLPVLTDDLKVKHYRLSVIVWALGLLVIGLAPNWLLIVIGVVILGIGVSLASQSRAFLLQQHVPKWAIGQGFAASAVLLYTADFLSLAIFGFVNSRLSAAETVVLCGVLMIVGLFGSVLIGRLLNARLSKIQEPRAVGGSASGWSG